MKIIVSNHHLHEYTGTEISTLTLCKYLSKKGHTVTVYSKYFSEFFVKEFIKNKIRPVDNLELIKNEIFDIGHIQHNISAYEIKKYFPNLPLIMWIHGTIPYLEQPPIIDLNISFYLTNNKEGLKHLKMIGINKNKIIMFRNIIDSEIFKERKRINKNPQKALIISNKLPIEKEIIIKKTLDRLNIKYEFIGSRFKIIKNNNIPNYINEADIVFTLGLGAIETMFCGRIPILFDYNFSEYEDGIVTAENFDTLKEFNFSGRATKRLMTEEDLLIDIKKYKQENGELLKQKALKNYEANQQIDKIINIYKKTIKEFKYKQLNNQEEFFLFNINQIIKETNQYTKDNMIILDKKNKKYCLKIEKELILLKRKIKFENKIKSKNKKIYKLEKSLGEIRSTKLFKIWRMYCKLIKHQ